MKNPFLEGSQAFMPFYLRIMIGVSVWFISYGVISFLGLWIATLITGTDINSFSLENFEGKGPAFALGLKTIQLFSDLGLFVVPGLLLPVILFQTNPVAFMGMKKRTSLAVFILAICLALGVQPLVTLTAYFNEHLVLPRFLAGIEQKMKAMEIKNEGLMKSFLQMHGLGDFLINTLIIAVLPAVAEELFFRGLLQKALQIGLKRNHLAIIITAFVFSFIHLEFYGFLPRFLLGLLLGYAYLWSGDIKVPILIHFANNFMDLCLSYYSGSTETGSGIQNSFGWMQVLFCVVSLFVLAYLVYIFKMKIKQQDSIISYEGN